MLATGTYLVVQLSRLPNRKLSVCEMRGDDQDPRFITLADRVEAKSKFKLEKWVDGGNYLNAHGRVCSTENLIIKYFLVILMKYS